MYFRVKVVEKHLTEADCSMAKQAVQRKVSKEKIFCIFGHLNSHLALP